MAFFAESLEARFQVENEDVVGAVPTGDAPTTSEWSTILLPTKVSYIRDLTVYGLPVHLYPLCSLCGLLVMGLWMFENKADSNTCKLYNLSNLPAFSQWQHSFRMKAVLPLAKGLLYWNLCLLTSGTLAINWNEILTHWGRVTRMSASLSNHHWFR